MKSDPFADQGVPAQDGSNKGKRDDKGQGPRRDNNRGDSKPKEKEKEVSMEEKLAMLVSKFKK
jgi:uncharacterized protein